MSPEGNFAGNIIVQGNAVGAALISGHHNQVIVIYGSEMLRGNPAEFSHLLENKAPPVPAGEAGPNPYQSLNAFDETCSHLFFGREELVDRLVAKLATLKPGSDTPHRLLAIMGPSGCGKSSVVRAGVVPRLVRGDVQGLEKALVVILQPGPHPVEALGLALARLATGDPAPAAKSREFGDLLLRSATGSTFDGLARLARMLRPYRAPLIVLIDQFEETWTLSRPTDRDAGERALAERRAFVCTLMHAATERDGNVIILLTLRSDFFGATAEFPDLNRAIANQPEITPVMSREELRAAISEPAKVAGHPLEHSMISRLLDEMEGQDSGLPLLQFALYQIWEGFHQRQTGHETLDRLEGVGGALASRAEEIFRSLPDERRRGLVRRAFEEMVQLGEGARDTRRRACLNDIVPRGSSEGDLSEALEPFVQERLISKGTNEKNQVVAELAHEALIRHWRMLRRWIEERRSDLRFGRRVQQTAIEWRDSNCPRGRLWRSPDLELLESYVRRYPQGITELGEKFFRSSTRARQRRQAFITIGIAGIASVAVVFAILYQRTERARSVAEAQKLAAQSDSTLAESSRYLERSALLAIESAKLQPLLENDNLLRVALALLPRHVAYIIHGGTVRDVHFSPDGRYVATASDDGSARDLRYGNRQRGWKSYP